MKRITRKHIDEYFLFSLKKVVFVVILWVVAVLLHNFIYYILGFEDAVFFLMAIVALPAYFLLVVFYTLIRKVVWR